MPKRSNEILVLDDEANYAEAMCHMLRADGYSPNMFTNPAEALAWLGKHRCALVLADYVMPQMNGAEFLQQAREGHPKLPIIMISGQMNTKELLSVANLGVSLVLEKPVDKDTLIQNVSRYVEPRSAPGQAAHASHAIAQPAAAVKKTAEPHAITDPYPTDDLRCSQISEESRAFLQSLWEALRAHNGVTLALPLGGELELVVSDVEHWLKVDPPALRISPSMLPVPPAKFAGRKGIAILDSRYATSDMHDAIVKLRQTMPGTMPLLVLQRTESAKPTGDLPLVILPDLGPRIGDSAFYAKAMLERVAAPRALTSDATRLLLNYAWPGNYYELVGAMRRAILAGDPENLRIDSKMLAEAIASGHGAASVNAASMTLEDHLTARQTEWFEQRGITDISEAAKAADVPLSHFKAGEPISRQPLVMQDVLTAKSEA